MKQFNIALTMDEETTQSIVSYAKVLYETLDTDVVLGKNSTPHLTIGQFSVDDESAKRVWERYKTNVTELPQINLAGITILPSRSIAGAWIEISVLKSQELSRLQEDLIRILHPFGVLTNDTGDDYRPHITVAHTTSNTEFAKFPYKYNILRLQSVKTALGIGLGTYFENFTFK